MKKGTYLTVGFLIFVSYLSFTLIWTGSEYQCDICIIYKDLEVCQQVKGMDKNETIMTGISTACAGAANGMTESLECQATQPSKLECQKI